MTTSEIETAVLDLVSQVSEVPVAELTRQTTLDDLGFDSLVLVELAMKLRKKFGLAAADDELNYVETVGELLAVVTAAREANA